MPNSGAPGFARTAAGACVLYLTGEYKDDRLTKLREEKKPNPIDYLHKNFDSPLHFYYGHYYAAHAMTLPSPYYLRHRPEYFRPSPPYPLIKELNSLEEATKKAAEENPQ